MLKQPPGFWNLFGADLIVRTAYQMGKTPVLPLFAAAIGASQMAVGTIVAVSTVTGMLQKPLIGACNGVAVGVGATMQLPFDIRLASDNARFGFVFARRGIVPEACSSWFLPRAVGLQTALEWCMTGRIFDAQEQGLLTDG